MTIRIENLTKVYEGGIRAVDGVSLFQVEGLPSWLTLLVYLDPVTYAVDGVRGVLLGIPRFPLALDLALLLLYATSMVVIGTYAFRRMRV